MFKVKGIDFYLPSDERFFVDCGVTTHTLNCDSDFIFTDDNFNLEGHFVELADG